MKRNLSKTYGKRDNGQALQHGIVERSILLLYYEKKYALTHIHRKTHTEEGQVIWNRVDGEFIEFDTSRSRYIGKGPAVETSNISARRDETLQ